MKYRHRHSSLCATLRAEVPFPCCKCECCLASCFLACRIGLSLFGFRKSRRLLARVGQGCQRIRKRAKIAEALPQLGVLVGHGLRIGAMAGSQESMQKLAPTDDCALGEISVAAATVTRQASSGIPLSGPLCPGLFQLGAWRRPARLLTIPIPPLSPAIQP